ncbi:hypothetical protein GCM10007928_42870 [Sulfitobacter porphyrae]|nr:hypothetical protein GCM10007928_42870 [Sulfitobacter porphyrae]
MRVIIPANGLAYLDAPDDFRHFSILVEDGNGDTASALRGVATAADQDHAWVSQETVRALSPRAGDPEWETSFAQMCANARHKNWLRDDGAIRAHLERMPPSETATTAAFRTAMRHFASGVCIVACDSPDGPRGMTITAFSSVSMEPPMALVCVNSASSSHDAITGADSFSVNILTHRQEDIAMAFAGVSGLTGSDRFNVGDWSRDAHRPPLLQGALQTIFCTPVIRQTAGSHTVLIGQVEKVCPPTPAAPLVNFDGALRGLAAPRVQAA